MADCALDILNYLDELRGLFHLIPSEFICSLAVASNTLITLCVLIPPI